MNAILRAIFYRTPLPGEVYEFDRSWEKRDPFRMEEKPWLVIVRDTKRGWVRYEDVVTTYSGGGSMTRSSFHFCYKRVVRQLRHSDDVNTPDKWRDVPLVDDRGGKGLGSLLSPPINQRFGPLFLDILTGGL
jgi:hypothetical protein